MVVVKQSYIQHIGRFNHIYKISIHVMDVMKRRVADGRVNSNRLFSMYALLPLDNPHKTQYALKNAYGLMCLGLLFWDKMIVVNI